MSQKERTRKWTSLLFVAGSLAGACGGNSSDGTEPTHSPKRVVCAPVRTGSIAEVLRMTGTLRASREVDMAAKIPGRVEKVFVERGASVAAGDPLVRLETAEIRLEIRRSKAAVAVAEASLADVRSDHGRMKNLAEEESISKRKWEQAALGLKLASAQLEQAQATRALAEAQLANAVIRSPINGVVIARNVEPGEVVTPPMMPGQPLLTVAHTRSLKVVVSMPERRVKTVRRGQEALITLDGFPDETFLGAVSKISPVVDPQSRTFEVEMVVPNQDRRLKPGMLGRVQLVLAKRTNALKVPLEAVTEASGPVTFVARDGSALSRAVVLGISDGVDVEILSGVELGEEVVVRGNVNLEDGDKIVVEPAGEGR